jgi:membrane-bound lytic murein transglycosylase B
VGLVASVLTGALPAVAAPQAPTAPATASAPVAADQTPTPAPVDDPTIADISPDLALVAVDGAGYRKVKANFDATAKDLAEVTAARANAETTLAQLAAHDRDLTQQIARDTSSRKQASSQLAAVHAALRAIAVKSYVDGTGDKPSLQDVEAATEAAGRAVVFEVVDQRQRAREEAASRQLDAADAALNQHLADRTSTRQQEQEVTAARDEAAGKEAELAANVAQGEVDIQQARARANVQYGDDMTLIALDAYWRAAQQMETLKPKCGITWWALAGIGRTEGHHGTFGGAQLMGNGDTSRPIVGITLDGTNDTAVIGDTDDGEYDGDAAYDHAVGPMQFIPSTWKRWKADGNGDGKSDPNNMYDATLGAAKYLCASGAMQSDDDLTRGYLSYNHSDDYAAAVLANAQRYRDNVVIPKVPAGGVVPAAATAPIPSGG